MAEDVYVSRTGTSMRDIHVYNVTSYNDTLYTDESLTSHSSAYDSSFATVMKLEKYTLPIICVLGLIGNTLSTITFLRRPLRNAPCSLYLATRGLSDNGFLLSLFLIWISSTFNLKLSQIKGLCQVIIFMTYVCGCVSVWLCVFITFENFLLIRSPFLARRICCNQFSKICISVLVLIAIGVYHTSLWISREDCSHDTSYSAWTQVLVFSDTLLTLVLPTVIIFVLLSVIAFKMIRIMHIRNLHKTVIAKITHGHTRIKPILPIAKVTKMLFVVSVTFFALNVPSHVIRLMLLTGAFRHGYKTAPLVQATIQTTFQLIYYLSFSINVCVYALFGSNFRTIFKKTFCKGSTRSHATYVQTEAVNLVHNRRHSMSGGYMKEKNKANCLMIPADDRECHSFT